MTYAGFLALAREIRDLGAAAALLSWDQETFLPPRGGAARARHRATLAGVIHDKVCDPRLGALLEALAGEKLPAAAAANVRETRRDRDRAVKVPRALVLELAEATSLAQQAWVGARERDDWGAFAPHLARLVDLRRREAEAIGYEGEPYNALLDEYEPGARAEELAPLFERLRAELVPILGAIAAAPAPDDALLRQEFDVAAQDRFGREVLADIGFDLEAGRLDTSAHPFTSGTSPGDVRLTTHYDPRDLRVALYATIHEGGHGLYEQGFPAENEGEPICDAASLGIHESQSRLWENMIGRSREFVAHYAPRLRELFPAQLGRADPEALYRAVNVVRPSLIRIEADEVTYNLHIILRLELERGLCAGRIEVDDLPALWNARMREYLGVVPPTDREGVLQDIHWAFGLFGYFPTYTLGNLYAAQFAARADADLGGLSALIARGDFATPLRWLREKIHGRGRLLPAADLCRDVTGADLDAAPFVSYLRRKYGDLYGLKG